MVELKTAPESTKTKKAREKLQERFEDLEKKVTHQALKKKMNEMKMWISKYALERVVIKDDSKPPVTKTTGKIVAKLQDEVFSKEDE